MVVKLTIHARQALSKRGITEVLVEEILARPEWEVRDKRDPSLTRAFGQKSFDSQWIRVVFRILEDGDILVVTVHPDRDAVRPEKDS